MPDISGPADTSRRRLAAVDALRGLVILPAIGVLSISILLLARHMRRAAIQNRIITRRIVALRCGMRGLRAGILPLLLRMLRITNVARLREEGRNRRGIVIADAAIGGVTSPLRLLRAIGGRIKIITTIISAKVCRVIAGCALRRCLARRWGMEDRRLILGRGLHGWLLKGECRLFHVRNGMVMHLGMPMIAPQRLAREMPGSGRLCGRRVRTSEI